MITRIITGVILVVFILIPGILLSGTFVLPVLCALLSGIAVYEIVKCFGQRNINAILIPSMAVGACVPIVLRYTFFENDLFLAAALMTVYVFYMFALTVFTNNNISIDDVAKTALMTVYISTGFGSIVLLRDLENGEYLFILAIIGAWITDIFAYFTGMLFGKHKLSPKISPKKSVEGAIGGIVGNMIFCVGTYLVCDKFFFTIKTVNIWMVIFGSILLSVIGMCGDLSASVIKRNYGEKDFGTLFPGHGGVLDRIDSYLFTMPAMYALIEIVLAVAGK